MPETRLTSHKRVHEHDSRSTGADDFPVKRQRLEHRDRTSRPLQFWEKASKIWLTRRTLDELDRQNDEACASSTSVGRSTLPIQPHSCAPSYLRDCGPAATRNIKKLSRTGGPDLSDLRSYPAPSKHTVNSSMPSRRRSTVTSHSRSTSTRTKSSRPYDPQFGQQLIDSGIFPHVYTFPDGSAVPKPENWTEIKDMLRLPRPSLSPSQFSVEQFERFVQEDGVAAKEKQVSESVIPIVEGRISDPKSRSGGLPFNNLSDLTKYELVSPAPDVYYGARPEQLHREVRNAIGHHITPQTQDDLPIAPNFFLEVKGPNGQFAVARRQTSYNGAIGARGMQTLRSYGQDVEAHDQNAYTLTSMYDAGTLRMYTSHVDQREGRSETYMNQLGHWGMTGDIETFQSGAAAYRNGRDWAEQQRNLAISRANTAHQNTRDLSELSRNTSPTLSFVTADETEELYTNTQESRIPFNEQHQVSDLEESDVEVPGVSIPAKRPLRRSTRLRKRPESGDEIPCSHRQPLTRIKQVKSQGNQLATHSFDYASCSTSATSTNAIKLNL